MNVCCRMVVILFTVQLVKRNRYQITIRGNNGGGSYPLITDSIYNPSDPSTPATIGFFGNAWTAKSFTDTWNC